MPHGRADRALLHPRHGLVLTRDQVLDIHASSATRPPNPAMSPALIRSQVPCIVAAWSTVAPWLWSQHALLHTIDGAGSPAAKTSLVRVMYHGGERDPVRRIQLGEHVVLPGGVVPPAPLQQVVGALPVLR